MRKKLAIILAAALTFNSFGAFAEGLAPEEPAAVESVTEAEEGYAEDDSAEEFVEDADLLAEEGLLEKREKYPFDPEIAAFNELVVQDEATLGQYLKSFPE